MNGFRNNSWKRLAAVMTSLAAGDEAGRLGQQ